MGNRFLSGMVVVAMSMQLTHGKECSRLVTAEMRAHALQNVQRHDWVAAWQKNAVAQAQPWLECSDERLWALVPSQELPRAAYIGAGILYEGKTDACPKCGEAISYGGKVDFWKQDWKVVCSKCGEIFPKNDFPAFYRSALDEHGFFRRDRGDKSRLVNAEHPDPNDPLHTLYVDDGYGMLDEKGRRHHVVAYYNYAAQWNRIVAGVTDLAWAYAMTSDTRYARKAAVLLDRIADVYPDMDYLPLGKLGFQHSHGGTLQGRIQGCIWECFSGKDLASAYDLIFDGIQNDEELVRFSAEQSRTHSLGDKSTGAAICRHIEDHLLLASLKGTKDGRIHGNTGMHQMTVAVAAIALDRPAVTEEWLDWLFDPDYPITNPACRVSKDPVPWVMVEGLDSDGMGGECGGYGLIWSRGMVSLAEVLAKYPSYTRHNIPRDYPKLRQCLLVEARLNCLDAVMPNIGDTGACGTWGRTGAAQQFYRGYRLLRDPRLAAVAWQRAGGDARELRLRYDDAFDADPEALSRDLAAAAKAAPESLPSDHLGRYGQACVQTERSDGGRALYIHYGLKKGHSHHDNLAIGLFAKNVDMLPDHGYPEFTGSWPQRIAWTSNTSSHNTLLIGDQRSDYSPGGKLNLFVVRPPVRLMEAFSPTAYGAPVRTYCRQVALVDVSAEDSYVLDIFRARGGSNHRLINCGPAPTAQAGAITLTPQAKGTLAGPEVEFTQLPGKDETINNTSGFSYLYDVARSAGKVDGVYTVDWKCEDLRGRIKPGQEPHLRLHALTPCDEVALASGQPPQNKSGNPKSLRYLIQSRLGEDLESQFVTVLEPYEKTPFITSVRRLTVEHAADANSVAAVAITLADGRVDLVVSCEQPTAVRVEGGLELDGMFGFVRLENGEVTSLRLIGGTRLRMGEVELISAQAFYRGTVTAVDVSDPAENRVTLEPALPPGLGWAGQTIHFDNALPQDTSFEIKAASGAAVSTGDITLVAGFKDPKDFSAGYRTLVNPGDPWHIPCQTSLDRVGK